jgi:DNA modification methylase
LEEKIQNNETTQSRTFNDRCLTCKKKFVGSDNTICHCPPELKITDKTIYTNKNNHPTVKPIALMEYLIKMVTPKGGVVLDPFAGSGSTLVAAKQNGFQYIGIEMTAEYIPIIEARLKGIKKDNTLF